MPAPSAPRIPGPLPLSPVLPVRDAVLFPRMIHTLHVSREGSRRAVRVAAAEGKPLLVVSQLDQSVVDPKASELCRMGTLCEVLQTVPLPDGSQRIALRGLRRAEAERFHRRGGVLFASAQELAEQPGIGLEAEAAMRAAVDAFTEILEKGAAIPPEAIETVAHQESPGPLADAIAHHLPLRASEKQPILEELDGAARLQQVFALLRREQRLILLKREVVDKVDRDVAAAQREFFLREQLRAIQVELDAIGEGTSEFALQRRNIESCEMPEYAHDRAMQELSRLERVSPSSPEGIVLRNYLEWMTELPWSRLSPDRLDIEFAKGVLDEAHHGLDKVKDRILDYLAVRQLSHSLRGPILCFVGPPGVGKTSVGKSIAEALGRELVRISLGGMRDEAEIRGHRRTYVGAMPGRILQSLRQCGTRNPVIVLDEIDKLASDFRGDPSSALLEALDPAQNERFSDHYLEIPFDLSAALFIATANLADGIPHALRDRLEIVPFPSYTDDEKRRIAEKYILPRQLEAHGLLSSQLLFSEGVLKSLVEEHTREAGVRELERKLEAVCRKAARQIAEGIATSVEANPGFVEGVLGQAPYARHPLGLRPEVGVAKSLVVTEYGGEVVPVEVILLEASRGAPSLKLTGNLGTVMRESAEAALSLVRSLESLRAHELVSDIHIHVPDNAVPKEGPSAGLTIVLGLASAVSGRPLPGDLAISGEITLRGKVLPIGGVREKVLAAHRAGLSRVLLPKQNERDLSEVPPSVLAELEIHLVETVEDALLVVLGEPAVKAAVRA